MEELFLIKPTREHAAQIAAYREEFLLSSSSMDGTGSLRRIEDPLEWLAHIEAYARVETLPAGRVPATQFLYVRESDRTVVGMIQVRHCFNEYLEKYGGHIGYSICPSERRKGYAKRMLRDCLPFCRELGLKKVLITCDEDNEGSRRTILANGGIYESTVFEPEENMRIQRYWIALG